MDTLVLFIDWAILKAMKRREQTLTMGQSWELVLAPVATAALKALFSRGDLHPTVKSWVHRELVIRASEGVSGEKIRRLSASLM